MDEISPSLQETLVQIEALQAFNSTLSSDQKELLAYIKVMEEHVYTTKTDLKGVITSVSDSFCRLTGYSQEELVGNTHNVVRSKEMKDALFTQVWKTISEEKIWEGDLQNTKKDGSYVWMHIIIFPRYDLHKNHIGYASIRHNITASKKLESEVIHDGLTGLYNRRYYDEVIERELMRARRNKVSFSFAIMDIDSFKTYNDTYGHRKGDEALQAVSAVLKNTFNRGSDFCFRLGGEEFGFFFTELTPDAAFTLIDGIRAQIESLKIPHQKNKASEYLTVSFGIINIDMKTTICDEQSMYIGADNALYIAKEQGKNRVCVHENSQMELF